MVLTRLGRLALSCLAAALAWLTTYPFELWPLALVCWIPFIIAISQAEIREMVVLGAVHGITLNSLTLYWVVEPLERIADLPAWHSLSAFGVFVVAQGGRAVIVALLYKAGFRAAFGVPLAFAISLVLAELVYPMVVPWQTAVFVQPAPAWLQVAEIGGALGVSFWIALVNGLLAKAYLAQAGALTAQARRAVFAAAGLVALVSAYGYVRMIMLRGTIAAAERVRIGLVQGYYGPPTLPWEAVGHYRNETAQLLRREGPVNLVVWPETAVSTPIHETLLAETLRTRVLGERSNANTSVDVPTLFGVVLEASESGLTNRRESERRGLTNSAVLGDRDGNVMGRYDKRELVPIGERQILDWSPAANLLPTLVQFTPGEPHPPPKLWGHPLGISICYEDILRDSFNESVRRSNPHLLINLTSDRWFRESPASALHLALSSLRAVEHRRYLVRATTTGHTAVIDPSGRVVWQLPPETTAAGVAEVRFLEGRSVYNVLGDWPWLILAIGYGLQLTWRIRRSALATSLPSQGRPLA